MTTFSAKQRKKLAGTGAAMKDGSFPIRNASDLKNAIQSVGRASNYNATKAHIIARAKSLNLTSLLPDSWKQNSTKLSAIDSLTLKLSGYLDEYDQQMIVELAEVCADDEDIVALSPAHSLAVKPGINNWVEKTSPSYGLPDYIGRIAQALVKSGHSTSSAISIAVATVKRWAAGLGGVNADTRAKAAAAVASWEKLKVQNKARDAANKLKNSAK